MKEGEFASFLCGHEPAVVKEAEQRLEEQQSDNNCAEDRVGVVLKLCIISHMTITKMFQCMNKICGLTLSKIFPTLAPIANPEIMSTQPTSWMPT